MNQTFKKSLVRNLFLHEDFFKDSELTAREKSLIALAVAHAVQYPYALMLKERCFLKKDLRSPVNSIVHNFKFVQSKSIVQQGVFT